MYDRYKYTCMMDKWVYVKELEVVQSKGTLY
jgi:hypothetical protein